MKRFIFIVSLVCSVSTYAGYDYTITSGYFYALTLEDNETLLMTGGGGDSLTCKDFSVVEIRNTSSPLAVDAGGIWALSLENFSKLDFSGGAVRTMTVYCLASATLSGGQIDKLVSLFAQNTHQEWNIEIICKGYNYDTTTKLLTGTWDVDNNKDGLFDTFNIQLVDVQGYSPTIENIKFIIPEPISLLLLAAGGVLVRRR